MTNRRIELRIFLYFSAGSSHDELKSSLRRGSSVRKVKRRPDRSYRRLSQSIIIKSGFSLSRFTLALAIFDHVAGLGGPTRKRKHDSFPMTFSAFRYHVFLQRYIQRSDTECISECLYITRPFSNLACPSLRRLGHRCSILGGSGESVNLGSALSAHVLSCT